MEPSNLLSRDGYSNLPVIHVGKVSLKKVQDLEHEARARWQVSPAGLSPTRRPQLRPAREREDSAQPATGWRGGQPAAPGPARGRREDIRPPRGSGSGPGSHREEARGRAGMPSAGPCPATLCPPSPGGSNRAPKAKGLPLDQRLPADGPGTWFPHTQHPPAEQPNFGHPRGLGPLTQSSQSSSRLCSLNPRGQHTVSGEECSQGVSPRLPALSEVEDSQSVLMEAVRPRLGPGRPRALQKACDS